MRTREAFRDAIARVAAFEPAFETGPAFTYLPGPLRAARPAGRSAPPNVPPAAGGQTVVGATMGMAAGDITAVDLVKQAYDAIAARSDELVAFTYVRPWADAFAEATLLDNERRAGRLRGPLHGIPISIKDVIHVAHMPTSASSRVPDLNPQTSDAVAVARLRAAGAIIIGKVSTHEFALGVTTPQSRNPWDSTRLPGGSSGGSAISLATGMSLASLGTDTRASIRVPAALSGTVGFKATYGLIPTEGVVTLSWSMDHTAAMTKNMRDAAIMLSVLTREPGANGAKAPGSYLEALAIPTGGLRVGVPALATIGASTAVSAAFSTALETLRDLGLTVETVDEPTADDFELANAAGLIMSRAEAASFHRPWRERRDLYTQDVGEQLDEALSVTAVEYVQAQRYREDLRRRMLALFERFDVLALPTSKVAAPLPEESDALLLVLSENCVPWSFIGFPAVSLPCGTAPGNLPIGLELVAAPYDERALLAVGGAYESAARITYV